MKRNLQLRGEAPSVGFKSRVVTKNFGLLRIYFLDLAAVMLKKSCKSSGNEGQVVERTEQSQTPLTVKVYLHIFHIYCDVDNILLFRLIGSFLLKTDKCFRFLLTQKKRLLPGNAKTHYEYLHNLRTESLFNSLTTDSMV